MAMDAYQKQLAAWQQAYPYLGASPTSAHQPTLGDYSDSRRKFMDMWAGANPYNGLNPTSFGMSQAEMEAAGNATNESRQAFGDYEQWGSQGEQAWRAALTPEQRAQYDELKAADYAKKQRMGQMAFLAAAGAMAAPGIIGAMGAQGGGLGAAGAAEGLGGLDAATVFGSGSGWGADTLGAMGLGGLGEGAGAMGTGLGGLGSTGVLDMLGGGFGSGLPAGVGNLPAGMFGSGLGEFGGIGSAAAGMGAGGGSSLLQQIQNAIGGGGGVTDALKGLTGSGGGINWLNLLGNLGGGWLQANASGNAAEAQLQAAREANALLREMWQQGRADQAPYREAGTNALAGIQALLKDPSSVASMPDYQFGLDQGTKALANSASARGMQYSGAQAKALQRYGQDYAGTKLGESFNRLASLAGIGQTATSQTGALGQNYANNLANNIENQGNVQGSAYMGKGNAWTNAIGGALNGLSEQDFINALLKGGG